MKLLFWHLMRGGPFSSGWNTWEKTTALTQICCRFYLNSHLSLCSKRGIMTGDLEKFPIMRTWQKDSRECSSVPVTFSFSVNEELSDTWASQSGVWANRVVNLPSLAWPLVTAGRGGPGHTGCWQLCVWTPVDAETLCAWPVQTPLWWKPSLTTTQSHSFGDSQAVSPFSNRKEK